MLALAVNAEDAARATAFCCDAIKAAIATDIEQAFARQVRGQTLLNHFPGLARMIDRFAHHAFGLGEDSVAEIDPMKPRLEQLQPVQNLGACHGVREVCAWPRRPVPHRTPRS